MERREALASFGPTSAGVPWPFDRVRDGQSDFLVDARRSLSEGKHLLAHAPTGLGKTAVALVAALDYGLAADKLYDLLEAVAGECEVIGMEVTAFDAPDDELERQDAASVVLHVLDPLLEAVQRGARVSN